ncbi:hypothetical protein ACI2LC_38660 [Nonomuraea wenchangensis]
MRAILLTAETRSSPMKATVGDRLILEGAYGTDSRREGFVAGR